ncbi:MAG: hypothetical protein U0T11_04870 [Chitinophagaceae bacterium]
MKKFYYFAFIIFLFSVAACSGSRKGFRNDEKDLTTLIKRLEKKGADEKIMADLQEVYGNAYARGAQRISDFQQNPNPDRWDNIIGEMETLQRMYEIISRSAYAVRMLKPVNYYNQLRLVRDSAATDYYNHGMLYADKTSRQDLKEAYYSFNKVLTYVPNYKDSRERMNKAYEEAIEEVLINDIQYDDYRMNSWNMGFYNNRDRTVRDNIIRDLGGSNASSIPARFYNEYDLRYRNIAPDLVVDLVWRNVRFDQPFDQTRTYQRNKKIEIGKDTANKPIYQTVYATIYVTRKVLNADADMNLIITDAENRQQLLWDRIPSNFRYEYEYASYEGDKRALDQSDWDLINRNRNQPLPTQTEAMEKMLSNIYQNIVSRIRNAVNW